MKNKNTDGNLNAETDGINKISRIKTFPDPKSQNSMLKAFSQTTTSKQPNHPFSHSLHTTKTNHQVESLEKRKSTLQ